MRTLKAAVLTAAAFFLTGPAVAQTIGCTGPTGGNCVPTVPFTVTGAINATNPLPVQSATSTAGTAGYPIGATPITGSATGTTGAVSAALASAPAKTTYLCTVQIGEAGTGTATATAQNTITGTLNYVVAAPGNFTVNYNPCVPASAVNTNIPVSTVANASATAVAVTVTGFQL